MKQEEEETLNACLALQRIWNYKEKVSDKKKDKETDRMMRDILKHDNSEWREQKSTCAKILDPKNHEDEKKKSWSSSFQLGQVVDKMELMSNMVGDLKRLEKFRENSRRNIQKSID